VELAYCYGSAKSVNNALKEFVLFCSRTLADIYSNVDNALLPIRMLPLHLSNVPTHSTDQRTVMRRDD
jgi:hypothetical protein